MSDLHPTPRATRSQYHVTHRVTSSGDHTLCGGFIPFTDNGHTAAIRGTAAKTDRTACRACEWMKYDVEPLAVTALLEAADEVLYRREVYRGVLTMILHAGEWTSTVCASSGRSWTTSPVCGWCPAPSRRYRFSWGWKVKPR